MWQKLVLKVLLKHPKIYSFFKNNTEHPLKVLFVYFFVNDCNVFEIFDNDKINNRSQEK